MIKKKYMLSSGIALATFGIINGGTHIMRVQPKINKMKFNKDKLLLIGKEFNSIPLNKVIIKFASTIGVWQDVPLGNQAGGVIAGTKLTFNQKLMKIEINDYDKNYYGETPSWNNNNIYAEYKLFDNKLNFLNGFTQLNNGLITKSTLNGAAFNYGDIIKVNAEDSYGAYLGTLENSGSCIATSGNSVYYKITQNGLIPLMGVYKKKGFENGNIITNQWLTVGNDRYYIGNDGNVYTGIHVIGTTTCTFNNDGVLESEKYSPKITFNSWPGFSLKGNTLQLIFDNGVIKTNGSHKWMGSNASNSYLNLGLYSSSGIYINDWNMTGISFGSDDAGEIDGQSYSNGDILLINPSFPYASSEGKNTITLENQNGIKSTQDINEKLGYKITTNALVPLNGFYDIGDKRYKFKSGIIEEEEVIPKITFNSWPGFSLKGNTLQLIFDNGVIKTNGIHKWMGSNASNSYLNLGLYSDLGNSIKKWDMSGTTFGSVNAEIINGENYKNGDILLVNASFPYASHYGKNTISIENENGQILSGNINGKIAYEIEEDGLVLLNGYHKLGKESYNFKKGVEYAAQGPKILGTNNITIECGSKFNPMEGVKLIDLADPNAKIEVEGTVNIEKVGKYKLTYKVIDSLGKTVIVTRIITVIPNFTKSNIESSYWIGTGKNQSLVINGKVDSKEALSWKVNKKLVLENSKGEIVKTINTAAINWYSSNKEDYSGFQGIISAKELSMLKDGENYNIAIEFNGEIEPLNSMIELPTNSVYYLGKNLNGVTISKIGDIIGGVANIETAYEYNNGFIINANINIDKKIIPKNVSKEIVITNSKGETIYKANSIAVNWYSSNKQNYSGLQAYIPQTALSNVKKMDQYLINVKILVNGKIYMIPIKSKKINIQLGKYNISNNNKNEVIIRKKEIDVATATLENKYEDGINTVENLKLNIPKVQSNSRAELKLIDNSGKVTIVNGILVNWYSKEKSNYNGVQLAINRKKFKSCKKAQLEIIEQNKTYIIDLNL